MRRATFLCAVLSAVCVLGFANTGFAGDEIQAKPVVSALDNPTGVAVQPDTGHLIICARAGVYRYVPGSNKATFEVNGYATGVYGKGPKFNIGPLGVAFLGKNRIVVGDGSLPDGEEVIHIFRIGKKAAKKTKKPSDAEFTLGPIKAGKDSVKGEGNYYGIVVNKHGIFATANGDDTKGWVVQATVKRHKPGKLKAAIATKVATNVDAPIAITNGPDGNLVIGQGGEVNVPADSLLTVYDPATGKLLKKAKTGLNDITGLAYSPKTGRLYAVDFSWMDTKKGGLFRLDVKGDEVTAEKILSLDKPTALAFGEDGSLYITIFGTASADATQPPGQVLKIDAGL